MKLYCKYQFYVKHNKALLFMLYDMLMDYSKVWNNICIYDYKYFNVSIFNKIHRSNSDKISQADLVKELVGDYSFAEE